MARSLKIFMRGKSVTALQATLRRMGYDIQDQPALFGTTTRDAVKSFQRQLELKPSGIVDDALRKRMQHGQPAAEPADDASITHDRTTDHATNSNPEKMDALIRLLRSKGILAEGELEAEMSKVIPSSL